MSTQSQTSWYPLPENKEQTHKDLFNAPWDGHSFGLTPKHAEQGLPPISRNQKATLPKSCEEWLLWFRFTNAACALVPSEKHGCGASK